MKNRTSILIVLFVIMAAFVCVCYGTNPSTNGVEIIGNAAQTFRNDCDYFDCSHSDKECNNDRCAASVVNDAAQSGELVIDERSNNYVVIAGYDGEHKSHTNYWRYLLIGCALLFKTIFREDQ